MGIRKLAAYYVKNIQLARNKLLYPISEFIGSYSETIGESLKQIFRIISNIVIFSPIFIISVVTGLLFTGENINISIEGLDILDTFVISILVFSSVLVLFGSKVYYDSQRNALLTSFLLSAAGISYYLFSPPNSYVVLAGILYALGGYITTIIEFETPYNHYHVYKKLAPHDNILDISITSGIVLLFVALFAAYSPAWISSDLATTGIVILTGLISYLVTDLQMSHYKDIYKHVNLKVQSQFWILVPQVLVIIGTGTYVFGTLNFLLFIGMIISPSIVGIIFSIYIENQVEGLSSNKKLTSGSSFYTYFSDSYHKSGKMRVKPHQNIDVESEFNESNSTARMKFTAELEIPEKFPEEFADMPWYRMAVICDRIDQTSKLMTNAGDEEKSKVNDFYSKLTEKTIDELRDKGSLMRFDEIPDSLVEKIRYELYNMDDTKVPDIHYFEVKSERPIKKKAKKYVESK